MKPIFYLGQVPSTSNLIQTNWFPFAHFSECLHYPLEYFINNMANYPFYYNVLMEIYIMRLQQLAKTLNSYKYEQYLLANQAHVIERFINWQIENSVLNIQHDTPIFTTKSNKIVDLQSNSIIGNAHDIVTNTLYKITKHSKTISNEQNQFLTKTSKFISNQLHQQMTPIWNQIYLQQLFNMVVIKDMITHTAALLDTRKEMHVNYNYHLTRHIEDIAINPIQSAIIIQDIIRFQIQQVIKEKTNPLFQEKFQSMEKLASDIDVQLPAHLDYERFINYMQLKQLVGSNPIISLNDPFHLSIPRNMLYMPQYLLLIERLNYINPMVQSILHKTTRPINNINYQNSITKYNKDINITLGNHYTKLKKLPKYNTAPNTSHYVTRVIGDIFINQQSLLSFFQSRNINVAMANLLIRPPHINDIAVQSHVSLDTPIQEFIHQEITNLTNNFNRTIELISQISLNKQSNKQIAFSFPIAMIKQKNNNITINSDQLAVRNELNLQIITESHSILNPIEMKPIQRHTINPLYRKNIYDIKQTLQQLKVTRLTDYNIARLKINNNAQRPERIINTIRNNDILYAQTRDIKNPVVYKPTILHKRLWVLDHFGEEDYKILPNLDYDYPIKTDLLKHNINSNLYEYKYIDYFTNLDGVYTVKFYDNDFNIIYEHSISLKTNYRFTIDNIFIQTTILPNGVEKYQIEFIIQCTTTQPISYCTITHNANSTGQCFYILPTETLLNKTHPIPFGDDLGTKEIPISIEIMIDFINILILIWYKFYYQFSGMTGKQAITNYLKIIYEWLSLDSTIQNTNAIEDYNRCFHWLRWEAERVYNIAKTDPGLKGNYYIELVVFEMLDYMEVHHINIVPEWDGLWKMDEMRNIFHTPQFDLTFFLDKIKGIRNQVITKRKEYITQYS